MNWDEMMPTERDQLVAEHVVGMVVRAELRNRRGVECQYPGTASWEDLPHYSQDIDAAFSLLADVSEWTLGYMVGMLPPKRYMATIWHHGDVLTCYGVTQPQAICKVALKAHGVDVDHPETATK